VRVAATRVRQEIVVKLAAFRMEDGSLIHINPAHVISIKGGVHTDIVTTGLTSSGTSRIYSVVIGAAEAADVINAAMKA
jgi:hypothetical protein